MTAAETAVTLASGTRLGRYVIVAPLGAGGMGEVYRARDERLERDVAVKVLPEAVATDADRLARFEREAKALARIEHPNILTIHDFGQDAPDSGSARAVHFAVTELLTGETLGSRLVHERLSWRRAAEIGAAVADGLAAAHGQSIVHRDLKPDNLFLTADGRVKILDFGLATSGLVAASSADTQMSPGAVTVPGAVLGTVGYMAPEQVHGAAVDARADLFALGCVLYEMVTGRRAFARATPTETLVAILSAPVPEVSASGVDAPAELGRVISRCLEKQPDARFQSASDLAYALRTLATAPVSVRAGEPAQDRQADGTVERAGAGSPSERAAAAAGSERFASGHPTLATPRARRFWLAWAAAAAVVLVAGGAFVALRLVSRTPAKVAATAGGLDPEKVVVAVFANRTGDPTLDALGLQISDWVTQNLSRISIKVGINPEVPSIGGPGLPRTVLASTPDPVKALAERTGAGLVVTGAYYLDGDSLRVQSQIVDASRGAIATSLNPSVGPRAKPSEVVASVGNVAMGALAARVNRVTSQWYGMGSTPNYDAYLEFTQGMAAFGPNYPEAERRLKRALELDPGYGWARLCLWAALSNTGKAAEADAVLRVVEEPGAFGRLAPVEQAYALYARASLDGRLVAELESATETARLSPTAGYLYTRALAESGLHRTRAAVETLSQIRLEELPPEAGPVMSWPLIFRAARRHELGDYEQQLAGARLGQGRFPAEGAFYTQEAGALVALGRLAEADAVMSRCEKAALRSGSVGVTLFSTARELSAHGHADRAKAMASRAASWYKSRLDAGKPTPALDSSYANALMRAGDCSRALPIRRDLMRQAPDNLAYKGSYATMLVSCGGSRAEAQRIADALSKVQRPFLRGEHLYQRARILAALGDGDGAMRALEAAFAQGRGWDGTEMHLDSCWDPIRSFPAFVEWVKPKG
jgi:TolB-like protein/tetratricopeptide (TPR) repeat protein